VLVRRSTDISEILTARMVHAQVTAATEAEARKELKGTPLSQLATYGPMSLVGAASPSLIRQRLDWLYGEDVT